MIELPFVFLAGLLGSAHCVGMCGGFALIIGSHAPAWHENLFRQTIYTLGRVFTYTWLGVLAAFGGARLVGVSHLFPAVLAILAGLFLIYLGLTTTGWLRPRATTGQAPCLAGSLLGPLLRGRTRLQTFLAGLATGFLPCGLLYGMLANAASSSHLLTGGSLMAIFGLGTMPAMVLTGFSGSVLNGQRRRSLFTLAGWCVVITGAITLTRGLVAAGSYWTQGHASCPYCP